MTSETAKLSTSLILIAWVIAFIGAALFFIWATPDNLTDKPFVYAEGVATFFIGGAFLLFAYFLSIIQAIFLKQWKWLIFLCIPVLLPQLIYALYSTNIGRRSKRHCPSCNKPLRLGENFCSNCGYNVSKDTPQTNQRPGFLPDEQKKLAAPIIEYKCPTCKNPLQAHDSFCGSCGTAFTTMSNDRTQML